MEITINVLQYVQVTGLVMLGLSIWAVYLAFQRGISVLLGTVVAVSVVWIYWIASYQAQLLMIMQRYYL